MRVHRRQASDIAGAVQRCFVDAQAGRIGMGLARVRDIRDEFPGNANVVYAEGLLYRDFLGEGVQACKLFMQAHEMASPGTEVLALSACNAALYAPDESAFRRHVQRAVQVAPGDPAVARMRSDLTAALDSGTPWWSLMIDAAEQHRGAKSFGEAAAFIEIALLTCSASSAELANAHRTRAHCLRELDSAAEKHRRTLGESFAPAERLALQSAVTAIDQALAADEWDAELWNLKAAWCVLLERYDEALTCADKAIALRPAAYAKPHQNKALALKGLGRKPEATAAAQTAQAAAQSAGAADDEALARQFLTTLNAPEPTAADLNALIDRVLTGAAITAQQEADPVPSLRQAGAAPIAQRLERMTMRAPSGTSLGHVPVIAELLSDMGPELAFQAVNSLAAVSPNTYESCLYAGLYVAARSESTRRRDAARFIVLNLLASRNVDEARQEYRRLVLEPASAATGDLATLDSIIGGELTRISPALKRQIADQAPVAEAGRGRGTAIVDRLTGEIPNPAPIKPGAGGCLMLLVILLGALVWFFFFGNRG